MSGENRGFVPSMVDALNAERGPKHGEIWDLGVLDKLEFVGSGWDFRSNKTFIFSRGGCFFVISKDEFFDPTLSKKLHTEEV